MSIQARDQIAYGLGYIKEAYGMSNSNPEPRILLRAPGEAEAEDEEDEIIQAHCTAGDYHKNYPDEVPLQEVYEQSSRHLAKRHGIGSSLDGPRPEGPLGHADTIKWAGPIVKALLRSMQAHGISYTAMFEILHEIGWRIERADIQPKYVLRSDISVFRNQHGICGWCGSEMYADKSRNRHGQGCPVTL